VHDKLGRDGRQQTDRERARDGGVGHIDVEDKLDSVPQHRVGANEG
jgi:hypothetical protein